MMDSEHPTATWSVGLDGREGLDVYPFDCLCLSTPPRAGAPAPRQRTPSRRRRPVSVSETTQDGSEQVQAGL